MASAGILRKWWTRPYYGEQLQFCRDAKLWVNRHIKAQDKDMRHT